MQLKDLFSGDMPSNVFRVDQSLDLSELERLVNEHDFSLFVLEGDKIVSKKDFLDHIEEKFDPPEGDNGKNWDAFEEVLEAPYWLSSKGVIIVYLDFQNFLANHKKDFEILLDVFNHATDFHNRRASYPQVTPLFVLLQGDNSVELPIGWLK